MGRGKQKIHEGQKIRASNQHTKGKIVGQIGNPKPITPKRKFGKTPKAPATFSKFARAYWADHANYHFKDGRLNPDTKELFISVARSWGRAEEYAEQEKKRIAAGDPIIKAGKPSQPAKLQKAEEAHFFALFEKFMTISEKFVVAETKYDPWKEVYS